MKHLIGALFLLPSAAMASPQLELPTANSIEVQECTEQAGQLMLQYSELFDLNPEVQTIRFESFTNTTPGTLNQEYSADISLLHSHDIELGVNRTHLTVTFSSRFICDDLKILKIVKHPIDSEDPLYLCLHNQAELAPLQAKEREAFQTHLDAMNQACESVPVGREKVLCWGVWNQTAEGQAQLANLSAAQKALSDYNQTCSAAFPQD